MSSPSAEAGRLARCRPLLGTFVTLEVGPAEGASAAVDAAFAAIARVQAKMSAHDPTSDLARIAREGLDGLVGVDPWTFEILVATRELFFESMGAIDPAVGGRLAQLGFLPPIAGLPTPDPRADFSDVVLKDGKVGLYRPLRLDLGGLAKGFAVDRAVEVLRAAGIADGIVNAGGDLRTWGRPRVVGIRHPAQPHAVALALEISDGALATSGTYWHRRQTPDGEATPLIRPWDRRSHRALESATALATTAFEADALAKILLLRRHRAQGNFCQHHAVGYRIDARGRVFPVNAELEQAA